MITGYCLMSILIVAILNAHKTGKWKILESSSYLKSIY